MKKREQKGKENVRDTGGKRDFSKSGQALQGLYSEGERGGRAATVSALCGWRAATVRRARSHSLKRQCEAPAWPGMGEFHSLLSQFHCRKVSGQEAPVWVTIIVFQAAGPAISQVYKTHRRSLPAIHRQTQNTLPSSGPGTGTPHGSKSLFTANYSAMSPQTFWGLLHSDR